MRVPANFGLQQTKARIGQPMAVVYAAPPATLW
jgi:hypothetical protein